MNRVGCYRMLLTAVCGLCLLAGCGSGKGKEETSPARQQLASSQDADGYVYKACDDTVYATTDVNIRTAATASSEVAGVLTAGQSARRVASNSSWSKILYEGRICYVSTAYVTTQDPMAAAQTAEAPTETEPETSAPELRTEQESEAPAPETEMAEETQTEESSRAEEPAQKKGRGAAAGKKETETAGKESSKAQTSDASRNGKKASEPADESGEGDGR